MIAELKVVTSAKELNS